MARTIRLKNLLLLAVLVSIVTATLFGFLYRRGQPGAEVKGLPSPSMPPHFLFSIYGEGLSRPIAVTPDQEGNIYVSSNNAHTVEVFRPNGTALGSLGQPGQAPGQMYFPYGVAILSDGSVLVAETGNFRMQRFSADGKFLGNFIGQPNTIGLEKPGPVVVDGKGRVYIGDLSANKVFILNSKGQVVRKIEGIRYPHGIAVDERKNRLYVSDAGQAGVRVYALDSSSQQPVRTIKIWGNGARFSMVRGVAVDQTGRVYVVDTVTSCIRVFDDQGKYLYSFGEQGYDDGRLLYPNGIATGPQGQVYVADWGNNRVSVWGY